MNDSTINNIIIDLLELVTDHIRDKSQYKSRKECAGNKKPLPERIIKATINIEKNIPPKEI